MQLGLVTGRQVSPAHLQSQLDGGWSSGPAALIHGPVLCLTALLFAACSWGGKGSVALHGFYPHDQGYWLVFFWINSHLLLDIPRPVFLLLDVEFMSTSLIPGRVV